MPRRPYGPIDQTHDVPKAAHVYYVAPASKADAPGTLTMRGAPVPVAVSGGWTAPDTYTLAVVRYQTPFVTTASSAR